VTPDAASGGALSVVESGDRVRLSVKDRRLELLVGEPEIARRRTELPPPLVPARGYARLYAEHITQPDLGCDFDFLRA